MKRRNDLTGLSLLEDDALDPLFKGSHSHPLAGLVLPVVVGVLQEGTVETSSRENPHQGKAAILLFSDEGTSCTKSKGINSESLFTE